jgi:hypothetical protein
VDLSDDAGLDVASDAAAHWQDTLSLNQKTAPLQDGAQAAGATEQSACRGAAIRTTDQALTTLPPSRRHDADRVNTDGWGRSPPQHTGAAVTEGQTLGQSTEWPNCLFIREQSEPGA